MGLSWGGCHRARPPKAITGLTSNHGGLLVITVHGEIIHIMT